MDGTQAQYLQDNFNSDTHIIHNLAHLLYSNVNRSCFGHLGCPQQDLFPKLILIESRHTFPLGAYAKWKVSM